MSDIRTPFQSLRLEDMVQEYYARFILDSTEQMVVDLAAAASYLQIDPLFDLACLAVTFSIKV